MRRFAAALALLAFFTQPAWAAEVGRIITLTLPRQAAANEDAVLRVRAGVLRRGMEIDVYGDGVLLGTVSPFGVRGTHDAGTYTIPLRRAPHGRRIQLRLVLTDAGKTDRAPTNRELRGVTLAFIKRS